MLGDTGTSTRRFEMKIETCRLKLREITPSTGFLQASVIVGFALLTWLGALVRVPLPFTPVPGTLQTLPVLLSGAILGARRGAASQAVYLLAGLSGLPVFALPGAGPSYLLGPTGGYLAGFILAPLLTGVLYRRLSGVWGGRLLALAAGQAAIDLCGFLWLGLWLGGGWEGAFRGGVVPFIVPDLAKVVVAAGLLAGWGRLRRAKEAGCGQRTES
jgi:biotin transport system substrate-specific component